MLHTIKHSKAFFALTLLYDTFLNQPSDYHRLYHPDFLGYDFARLKSERLEEACLYLSELSPEEAATVLHDSIKAVGFDYLSNSPSNVIRTSAGELETERGVDTAEIARELEQCVKDINSNVAGVAECTDLTKALVADYCSRSGVEPWTERPIITIDLEAVRKRLDVPGNIVEDVLNVGKIAGMRDLYDEAEQAVDRILQVLRYSPEEFKHVYYGNDHRFKLTFEESCKYFTEEACIALQELKPGEAAGLLGEKVRGLDIPNMTDIPGRYVSHGPGTLHQFEDFSVRDYVSKVAGFCDDMFQHVTALEREAPEVRALLDSLCAQNGITPELRQRNLEQFDFNKALGRIEYGVRQVFTSFKHPDLPLLDLREIQKTHGSATTIKGKTTDLEELIHKGPKVQIASQETGRRESKGLTSALKTEIDKILTKFGLRDSGQNGHQSPDPVNRGNSHRL